jgi:diacylglycerol kinase (ATP)
MLRGRPLIESFNCAFHGIVHTLKTQRNMRLHFVATGVVLALSLYLKLEKLEILILLVSIAFVIVAEMINTAIEATVDLITTEIHPIAAIAKNVAAGAVLVAAILALIVGYLIFYPKFNSLVPLVIESLAKTPAYLTLIAIVFTVVFVVVGKALTKKGSPVHGGMPSGHTALGAAAATTILFLTHNSLIALLAFFMAFIIAESRMEAKIHSIYEVLAGGLLGFLVTLFIFQLRM